MSDQILKETSKALKIGLGDKAGAVVRECAEASLLVVLSQNGSILIPSQSVPSRPFGDYYCLPNSR